MHSQINTHFDKPWTLTDTYPEMPLPLFPMSSSSSRTSPKNNQKPQGLWRARVTVSAARFHHHDSQSDTDNELDELEYFPTSSKKRRCSSSESSSDSGEPLYFDYSRQCTPPEKRESSWTRRTRIMDTTSLALKGIQMNSKATCDYEDWEDLKDLFSKAIEQYEGLSYIV